MSGGPTIRVHFGDEVAAGELFVVELDDTLNLDAEGEVKSQFYPGDEIFFLMHYDHSLLTVRAIRSTSGDVVVQGEVGRSHTAEMLFEAADAPVELGHNPSGGLSAEWYGRSSALSRSGRSVSAASTPCIGDVTYGYTATSCRLIPPPLELAEDEEYPIAVVIYVESA